MRKELFLLSSFWILILLSTSGNCQISAANGQPKFSPKDGKKILVIGQDLGSVGGLARYSNGYVDHVGEKTPSGITTYTSIESLNGLRQTANWGAGDINAQLYMDDSTFDNTVLVIGLYLVGILDEIGQGQYDQNIIDFARWIKDQNRPIFIRIGYEFEGPWNNYNPSSYKNAWRHIVHIFDTEKVNNASFVWQSAGLNYYNIENWYPGDEYVNWVGYSQFDGRNMGQGIKQLAARKNKPIMIAEATPKLDLSDNRGEQNWQSWFQRVFDEIYENDRIKAFCYINANWDVQTMWAGQGWGDSRVQQDEYIKEKWETEIIKEPWLHGEEGLFQELDYYFWTTSSTSIVENDIADKEGLLIRLVDGHYNIQYSDERTIDSVMIYEMSGKLLFEERDINNNYIRVEQNNLPIGIVVINTFSKSENSSIRIYNY